MRQIKFRGKRLDNGEWVYGDLLQICGGDIIYHGSQTESDEFEDDGKTAILLYKNEVSAVHPSTVGQFTGLLDRNGKEVYEGDVVFWIATDTRGRGREEQGAIFWDKHTMSWAIERDKPRADGRPCIIPRPFDKRHLEVVGNIHDNPEYDGTWYYHLCPITGADEEGGSDFPTYEAALSDGITAALTLITNEHKG